VPERARPSFRTRRAGRPGRPRIDDLNAACTWRGTRHIVNGRLRQAFQTAFADQLVAACTAVGLVDVAAVRHARRRSLERVAARRALQLCHILTIRGRGYRW
jgi:hypothetical protein